jgi:excisionase family DNA binding protein
MPQLGQDRPRLVVIDELTLTTPLDPFLSLKALAGYSGLSVRTLRTHLGDLHHPLPCYRVGGKILIRRSEFDAWMARYRRAGDPLVERVVADVLGGLGP